MTEGPTSPQDRPDEQGGPGRDPDQAPAAGQQPQPDQEWESGQTQGANPEQSGPNPYQQSDPHHQAADPGQPQPYGQWPGPTGPAEPGQPDPTTPPPYGQQPGPYQQPPQDPYQTGPNQPGGYQPDPNQPGGYPPDPNQPGGYPPDPNQPGGYQQPPYPQGPQQPYAPGQQPYGQGQPGAYGPGQQPQPYAQGPQPGPYGPGQQPVSDSDARLWSTLSHVGMIITGFIAPLIIWVVYKDRSPLIRGNSLGALNFGIITSIGLLVSSVLSVIVIGYFMLLAIWVLMVAFGIMGAVAANRGEVYNYPFNVTWVK